MSKISHIFAPKAQSASFDSINKANEEARAAAEKEKADLEAKKAARDKAARARLGRRSLLVNASTGESGVDNTKLGAGNRGRA